MTDRKPRVKVLRPTEEIQPFHKGLGAMTRPMSPKEISSLGWNLLREDLSLPTAVLYEEKLRHNLEWMQEFAGKYGANLAPHGKTTMAPKLFAMQMQAGAWGITLATAQQVRIAYEHGVRRVLMANQLVGRQNMETIATLLLDRDFDYYCLVDSAAHVEQLGRFFRSTGKRLRVLLELGVEGGRSGVRNAEQLQALLDELSRWKDQIALCGVEIYEGISEDESAILQFLQHTVEIARDLACRKQFARTPVILSGAGSAWYDVVADAFSRADLGCSTEIVLRPGCYLTHDAGAYAAAQKRIKVRNPVAQHMLSTLMPALQVWAYVQSVPEGGKAIVGLGKRDASFDSGLPSPAAHVRHANQELRTAPAHWKLTRMMDQHAYLQIAEGDDIGVGDMVGFDICHPCLTFDKWRYLPVLDADYRVIDVIETFF